MVQNDYCNLFRCHAIIYLQYITMHTDWFFPFLVNWCNALKLSTEIAFVMEAEDFLYRKAQNLIENLTALLTIANPKT